MLLEKFSFQKDTFMILQVHVVFDYTIFNVVYMTGYIMTIFISRIVCVWCCCLSLFEM